MKPSDLAQYIDHTLLRPEATPADVERLCLEAIRFSFRTVCLNSVYIPLASQYLQGSKVHPIAVVGFPLGACGTASKCFEAERAIASGAVEIDMVIWSGALKAGMVNSVLEDIRAVVQTCDGIPLKVILETVLLNREEKQLACQLALEGGAQFVKTCTGFLGGVASIEDVSLMRAIVGPGMGVKASGGIRNFDTAVALLQAGANRLGTSNSVAIVNGDSSQVGY